MQCYDTTQLAWGYATENKKKLEEIEAIVGNLAINKILKLIDSMNQQLAILEYQVTEMRKELRENE